MKNKIIIPLIAMVLISLSTWAQDRNISVDLDQVRGPLNTQFKECIGAGRANEGLRADWQQQLATTYADCGFRYIRMHGLLTDDMAVYKINARGEEMYNFMYIDALYDYILELGMKPFVELGFMPSAMASGDQTIFWWRGNVTPPSDYDKWQELNRRLVQHWTDRYGEEEVKTWYFEVWNEPNLFDGFWTGTKEEYFKLYQYAAQGVKSVNSEYRTGGPATAGTAWVPEMIAFCEEQGVPLDFITTHDYGVQQGFLDEYGTTGTVLNPDKRSVSGKILEVRDQITASTRPELELHITEWSASYTPADPIHDSYHEAAYIIQKLKQVDGSANSMSYWVFTDIFEEAGPRFLPFHGGFGLMTIQGIKKSAYHAYSFLNKLGDTELVNEDKQSWATKNADGSAQILFWDFTYTLPDSTNNQQYYIRDLPAKDKGKVEVNIDGLAAGQYELSLYKVGYGQNDPHTEYVRMGRPDQLTREQVATLKAKSTGAPIEVKNLKVGKSGRYKESFDIAENDVYLIDLNKN